MGSHNFYLHCEHHDFVNVPFYNLPALSRFLSSNDEGYRTRVAGRSGYVRHFTSQLRNI